MASLLRRPPAMMKLLGSLATLLCLSTAFAAAEFRPLSESDKIAAKELFDVSGLAGGSLEKTYQALRSLQVLGSIPDEVTCQSISQSLTSSSDEPKHVFYAVKIAEILNCKLEDDFVKVAVLNMVSSLKDAGSLFDFHFAIGALTTFKKQQYLVDDLILEDAIRVFNAIKALSQSDGTWRYSSSEGKSSMKAAGLALETFAGLFTLSGSHPESEKINQVKGIASKLFESIESYDDGAQYFDEKKVDTLIEGGGPLAVSSSVVRGVAELAAVVPGRLKIEAEKFVGLANFFLSLGVPRSPDQAFYELDALGYLESNSFIIPVLLSLPYSVLSLRSKDLLQVAVTTVLGSAVPATVTLATATKAGSKGGQPFLANQALESVPDSSFYKLDLFAKTVDVGKYDLTFKVKLVNDEKYVAGGLSATRILVTGLIEFSNVEVGVLDSDTGSTEVAKILNPSTEESVALFANHLQKFRILFDATSPFGEPFKPHQVFLKFKHESGVEHLFLIKSSGKRFKLTLDFLGLLEKFYYLSGIYKIELAVGDPALENPFLWSLGTIDLDLPEPPEGAPKPPAAAKDISSVYGPKLEISHVFRLPEKRPPPQLSDTFLVLTLLPLLGFLIGLYVLGANVKSLPSSSLSFITALGFHGGIAGVLGLYFVFWLKLNLFTTLKYLGISAIFLFFSGHHILSYLANSASKVKNA